MGVLRDGEGRVKESGFAICEGLGSGFGVGIEFGAVAGFTGGGRRELRLIGWL